MAHPEDPLLIEGYDLVPAPGPGGRASLRLAQQVATRRPVVIKLFSRDFAGRPEDLALFTELAPKIKALRHAGVIPVIDFGFAHGRYYFVMDRFAGETLDDFASSALPFCDPGSSAGMPEDKALDLAQSAAEILHYADSTGRIIHGNLKPDNLVWSENRLKLMDLGVLFAMGLGQSRRNLAFETMAFGTPGYTAPEQIQRQVSVDCRADIYALGLTLYYFLTGHKPFTGTDGEVVSRQLTDCLTDPRDYNPRLSENTVMWLVDLTSSSPSDRPSNWTKVLAQLQALRQGQAPADLRNHLNPSTIHVRGVAMSKAPAVPLRNIPTFQPFTPEVGAKVPVKDSGGEYKACPFCAERIRRQARVCRFCNRPLTGAKAGAPVAAKPGAQRRPPPLPMPAIPEASMEVSHPRVRSTQRWGKLAMVVLNLFLIGVVLVYGYMKLFKHQDLILILKQSVIDYYTDPDIAEAEAWEKTQNREVSKAE